MAVALHRFVKERALFFIFAGGFVISVGLAGWTGWNDWVLTQHDAHQPALSFGSGGFIWSFCLVIFSNISSNLFGQSLVIILTAYFIYRHSAESRDEEDTVERLVEELHRRVAGGQERAEDEGQRNRGLIGFWNNYSLGILFVFGFLFFMGLQTWTGWISFQAAQSSSHQIASFGSFLISDWGYNTWQNWQADLLGPAVQLVLARHFIFKGSSQSRESEERMKKLLRESLGRLHDPASQDGLKSNPV